ncbi:MAG: flippase [Candidatus Margulisbacteria bacterium]|nr:flippase [Candidatus Margulisiibacteriota bacterium]
MGLTRQITKNFSWLFFGEFLNGLISFFIVVYLARVLGVKTFGLLSFVQAFLIYLLIVVDAGFTPYGIREMAKDISQRHRLAVNIIALRIIWGLLVYLMAAVCLLFLPLAFELKLLFAVTFLLVISKNMSPEWIFHGLERFEYVGLEKILNRSILALLIVLFVKGASDLIKAPFLEFVVGFVVASLFLTLIVTRFVSFRAREIKFKDWRYYFVEAAPMGISYVLLQLYFNIDTVMLGLMNRIEDVGFYSAAYKIIFALLIFATVLGKSIYPVLSRLYAGNREKMKKLVSALFNYNLFLGIPIAVGGMILSEPIVLLVFGAKYYPAAWAFRILVWTILTVYTSAPFTFSLLAAGRQRDYFYGMAAGASVNILLNLFLIPSYGFVGAAVAKIVTEVIVWGIIFYYFSKNVFYIPLQRSVPKYLVSAAVMGLFIYFVKINIFLSVIGGAAVYLLFNLLLGSVSLKGAYETIRLAVNG